MHNLTKFFWDNPYLYRSCVDGIIRRCVPEVEMLTVLEACYSSPWMGIIVVFVLPTRFCRLGTNGQLFTMILMSLPSHVIGAKEMEEFLRGKSSL